MLIYKVTNLINGTIYIGQTRQLLSQRWHQHNSCNKNRALTNAIKKYGKENFTIEEIDGANSLSELNYLEQHYIWINNSLAPNGYNMVSGGGSYYYSQESKRKMSESAKKKTFTQSHRENISKVTKGSNNPFFGKHHNEESKKKLSEERQGEKHHFFGKKHSEETKEKMRQARLGKKRAPFSEEWKKKLSDSLKGNARSKGRTPWNKGKSKHV